MSQPPDDYGYGERGEGGRGDYGRGDYGYGDYGRGDYGRGDYGRGDFRRPIGDVPTYLAPAILTTLFCCTPGGIVAIVFAAQVPGKLASGDYEGAVRASNTAKLWCWLSFGSWLALVAIVIVIQIGTLGGGPFR
jgi:hypothetical protein